MKCRIMHESSERIRVRLCKPRLNRREADLVEYYLLSHDFVVQVRIFERKAGVEIFYQKDQREKLIYALSKFSFSDRTLNESVPTRSCENLNRKYFEKLTMMVVSKFARDIFLPAPIRILYILLKSIPFIVRGFRLILKGKLRVEVLDALAIGVSVLRGDFDTAASVMFLLNLGEMMEEWTHKKSVDDLARTMSLDVDKVWLKANDQEVLTPISKIKLQDRIVVHSGNLIPLDGRVDSGEAMVNQSSFTGESVPVLKKAGSTVYAGTVLEEGSLVISVSKIAGEGRYDRIVSMIEESEKLKSDSEARYALIADKLVPFSFLGTGLVYALTGSFVKAVSVLMVDFSCALKLAMPISVLSAMRESRKYGITVKGGKFLEQIAVADTIVLDKTGTLTHATPTVAKVLPCSGRDEKEMLRIAACLEEHFPHSIANAVVTAAENQGLHHEEMHTKIEYIVAHGIATRIGEERVIIGSRHFVFEDEKTEVDDADLHILEETDPKYSQLYLAIGGKLAAVICIHDPLRKEARQVIQDLRGLGFTKIVMMTGDSMHTASAIAKEVGVDEFYAEVLPEDKSGFVEREKMSGKTVIMVGDGINDSPALGAASCGVAIHDGAAIAREVADITISGKDLTELVKLKRIANGLMKRIHGNFDFIIGFNSLLLVLGIMGMIQPTASALFHNASTLGISMKSMTNILKDKPYAS